jgi:hypothetical protein
MGRYHARHSNLLDTDINLRTRLVEEPVERVRCRFAATGCWIRLWWHSGGRTPERLRAQAGGRHERPASHGSGDGDGYQALLVELEGRLLRRLFSPATLRRPAATPASYGH